MTDQILIPESMLDDFESTWRRRRRMTKEAAEPIAWTTLVLSFAFLVSAVILLFSGNDVGGLTFLACVPIPAVSLGLVFLVVRRDARKADEVLRMIDDIRQRGPTAGGRP